MAGLPVISSFWQGPRLSFMDQLCLKSFSDHGHQVKLYSPARIENLPEGVEQADAHAIMEVGEDLEGVAAAKIADIFRYRLLHRTNEIWVDTDAYCLRPFPDQPYFFAPHFRDIFANGVLRLPRDSRTLSDLVAFTASGALTIPEGMSLGRRRLKAQIDALRDHKGTVSLAEAPYEMVGPFAFTYFLRLHGENVHAMDKAALYPIQGGHKSLFLRRPWLVKKQIPPDALSVHLYGSGLRRLFRRFGLSVPPKGTYLDHLCREHGIEPELAPL